MLKYVGVFFAIVEVFSFASQVMAQEESSAANQPQYLLPMWPVVHLGDCGTVPEEKIREMPVGTLIQLTVRLNNIDGTCALSYSDFEISKKSVIRKSRMKPKTWLPIVYDGYGYVSWWFKAVSVGECDIHISLNGSTVTYHFVVKP